jgi:hypothetical protein
VAEAAAPRKPPLAGMMRFINVVPGLILRSPLHGLMSRKTLMLGFTGRRSGQRYTIPMSYVRVGDEVLMSTEAP